MSANSGCSVPSGKVYCMDLSSAATVYIRLRGGLLDQTSAMSYAGKFSGANQCLTLIERSARALFEYYGM